MPTKELSSYLFLGEEDFLKESELERLRSKFLDKATRELNYSVFHAKEKDFNIKDMLDMLNTAPFMSKKRFVVLKDADSLADRDKESVLFYLRNQKESSIFIIDSRANKINEGFILEASKLAKTVNVRRLTDSEIMPWLTKKARLANKKIDMTAASLIKENLPNDLNVLSSSMDNLILYTGKRPNITRQDVEKVISATPMNTSFDLLDAIEKRDSKKALNVFNSIQRYKKREIDLLLGLLSWQFRMLLRLKELLRIKNRMDAQRELRLYGYKFDQIMRYAARFTKKEILRVLSEILKADNDIKTGEMLPRFVLERLILRICS
jgi:DNA polymerase-3 subunit delta